MTTLNATPAITSKQKTFVKALAENRYAANAPI
jgi:hypothetical protein